MGERLVCGPRQDYDSNTTNSLHNIDRNVETTQKSIEDEMGLTKGGGGGNVRQRIEREKEPQTLVFVRTV
jgi:hypothetical protein